MCIFFFKLTSSFLLAIDIKFKKNLRKLRRNESAQGKALWWCLILKGGQVV